MSQKLDDLRRLWEEIDDVIALMPESLLVEVLSNPHLSERDRARVKARLAAVRGNDVMTTIATLLSGGALGPSPSRSVW